jgi:hypothetical protein
MPVMMSRNVQPSSTQRDFFRLEKPMYDPMPAAYKACADNASDRMMAGERRDVRLNAEQISIVNNWLTMPDQARADDMRDASDYRDFDERLWSLVMKRYQACDPEIVDLVHDMAQCRAELTTDTED